MDPCRSRISFAKPFSLTLIVYSPVTAVVYDEEILVVICILYERPSLHHQVQVRILGGNTPLVRREPIVLKLVTEALQFRLNQEVVLFPSYQTCVDSVVTGATAVGEGIFGGLNCIQSAIWTT